MKLAACKNLDRCKLAIVYDFLPVDNWDVYLADVSDGDGLLRLWPATPLLLLAPVLKGGGGGGGGGGDGGGVVAGARAAAPVPAAAGSGDTALLADTPM